MIRELLILAGTSLLLAGCAAPPATSTRQTGGRGEDIVLFALGLIETGYRFGGRDPNAGFDCSGMVSYVYDRAAGVRLTGSAAEMARSGRPVATDQLRPGDLVFFNTGTQRYSHVGIYIGDGRFVHAPSSQGRVRTDSLTQGWFAARFEAARSYFD
jgi:cell wall-associated NlpC family hydrolase